LSFDRILRFAAAIAAVAAAVVVCLVAAAFALYALAAHWLGAAGGAAVVAGLFALIAAITAAAALGKVRPSKAAPPEPSPVDRIIGMAKERPILAVGAAVLAGVVLFRNPAVVTALISAFLAGSGGGKPPPPKGR
jgi:hypothetical protein